ncbi:hypothetical protein E2562_010550 [Oryza meyeriana var. granulata]|uniref:Uncharacterized protein n=1 Tax=Oryza meyeriana var. granulata TaxID=110450 RepID=A0A6G1BUI3_9ORYZ|nr:hypothetical protein E2562_010550 [Oryza meyeriana var. granulata]
MSVVSRSLFVITMIKETNSIGVVFPLPDLPDKPRWRNLGIWLEAKISGQLPRSKSHDFPIRQMELLVTE